MPFAGGTPMAFGTAKWFRGANITPAVNGIPVLHGSAVHRDVPDGEVGPAAWTNDADAVFRNMTDQDLKDVFAY